MKYFMSLIFAAAMMISAGAIASEDREFLEPKKDNNYLLKLELKTSPTSNDYELPLEPYNLSYSESENKNHRCKIRTVFFTAGGVLIGGYCLYSLVNGTPVFPWVTEIPTDTVPTREWCEKALIGCAQKIYETPEILNNAKDSVLRFSTIKFTSCMSEFPALCQSIPNIASVCLRNIPWDLWNYLSWNASTGIMNLGRSGESTYCQFFNNAWSCIQSLNGLGQITRFTPNLNNIEWMQNLCNTTGEGLVHLTSWGEPSWQSIAFSQTKI